MKLSAKQMSIAVAGSLLITVVVVAVVSDSATVRVYKNGVETRVSDVNESRRIRRLGEIIFDSANDHLWQLATDEAIANLKRGLAVEISYRGPHLPLRDIRIKGMLIEANAGVIFLRSWNGSYESGPSLAPQSGELNQLKELVEQTSN